MKVRWGPGRRPKAPSAPDASQNADEGPTPVVERLTCERCGYTEEVGSLVDDNGSTVAAVDDLAALKAAGIPVLCSGCRGDDQAAEEVYRGHDPA